MNTWKRLSELRLKVVNNNNNNNEGGPVIVEKVK